jgi:Flp pilus assembly protein CpaB
MKRTPNVLVAIGMLAFLIGAGLVVGTMRSHDSGPSAARASSVLVATATIPAGTSGEDLVTKKLVTSRDVGREARAADAVSSTAELTGRTFNVEVAPGEQVRTSQLRPQTLRASAIAIPVGKQGVAVQLPFVAGGAGYVAAGDRVNVYGNVPGTTEISPVTKLVLANVQVLDVSTEVAPRVAGGEERPIGTTVTYLLALDANQAEQVIYLTSNAQLWLALADGKDAPMPPTSGRRAGDVLP